MDGLHFNLIRFDQTKNMHWNYWIQSSQTTHHSDSDTSPYGECLLNKLKQILDEELKGPT